MKSTSDRRSRLLKTRYDNAYHNGRDITEVDKAMKNVNEKYAWNSVKKAIPLEINMQR